MKLLKMKQTPLGWIPEDWGISQIEESAIHIIDGDRGKNYPKQEEFSNKGFCLFLSAANVTKSGFNFNNCQFISQEKDGVLRNGRLKRNDIVLTTRGTVGNIAYYDNSVLFEAIRINSGMVILRNMSKIIDTKYLYTVSKSHVIQNQVRQIAFGSAQPQLTVGTIKRLLLPLPPLPEQCKIADILSTWDEAIELTEQLIAAKQKRKQALMQRLLTGQMRFSEFVISEEKQEADYGELPADWQYVSIDSIAMQVVESNSQNFSLPVLSCTKYDGLVDSLEYFGRQIFSEDLTKYKIVKRHQFAYATNHIEEGSIGYQNIHDAALISPMYTVFKSDQNCVYDGFLYRVLKTERYRQIFALNTNGSVNRRGSLRWKEFSKIKVPIPTIAEQQRISTVIDIFDQEIDLLQQKLTAQRQQKKGLMQQLLTGKIRVKV